MTGNVLDDNGSGADSDIDASDILTVTQANGESGDVGSQIALPSGALLTLNGNGTFSYDSHDQFETLGTGQLDTDTFTYEIFDGNSGTDTATVTITINGVNDAPVAIDDSLTTDEQSAIAGDVFADNKGAGADSDIDVGDMLTVTAVNGEAGDVGSQITLGSGALLTLNSDGTFSYDLNEAFDNLDDGSNDTDTFTYTVSDGNGGSDTATVSVLVNGITDQTLGGTANADLLAGGDGDDVINGLDGNDTLKGAAGDDVLNGGQGNDELLGGAGSDILKGAAGDDSLEGGDGDDELFGGNNNDTLKGGGGADTLQGDLGDDLFAFGLGVGTDQITDFDAGSGSDDVIELIGFGTAFDAFGDVLAAGSDVNGNFLLDLGSGDSITLTGVLESQLDSSDFIFSP